MGGPSQVADVDEAHLEAGEPADDISGWIPRHLRGIRQLATQRLDSNGACSWRYPGGEAEDRIDVVSDEKRGSLALE